MAYQPKSYKKFVATAATATLVASAVAPAASANVQTAAFTDVAPQYAEAIDWLVSEGYTSGKTETSFGVAESITRGDAAIILAQAAELLDEEAPSAGFTDVPARGALYINSLFAAEVVNGKSATQYGFADNITRGEMAILVANAFGLTGDATDLPFTDVNDRYAAAVAALFDNGVTSGVSATQFGTDRDITRGDFARFIYAAADAAGLVDPVEELPTIDALEFNEEGDMFTLTFSELPEGADLDWVLENYDVLVNGEMPSAEVLEALMLEITDVDGNVVTVSHTDLDELGLEGEEVTLSIGGAEDTYVFEVAVDPMVESVMAVNRSINSTDSIVIDFGTELSDASIPSNNDFEVRVNGQNVNVLPNLEVQGENLILTLSGSAITDNEDEVRIDYTPGTNLVTSVSGGEFTGTLVNRVVEMMPAVVEPATMVETELLPDADVLVEWDPSESETDVAESQSLQVSVNGGNFVTEETFSNITTDSYEYNGRDGDVVEFRVLTFGEDGQVAVSETSEAVTLDGQEPELVNGTVNRDELVLTFDENFDLDTTVDATDFTVSSEDGIDATGTDVTVEGNMVTVELDRDILTSEDNVTVSYTGSELVDEAGNAVDVTDEDIDNITLSNEEEFEAGVSVAFEDTVYQVYDLADTSVIDDAATIRVMGPDGETSTVARDLYDGTSSEDGLLFDVTQEAGLYTYTITTGQGGGTPEVFTAVIEWDGIEAIFSDNVSETAGDSSNFDLYLTEDDVASDDNLDEIVSVYYYEQTSGDWVAANDGVVDFDADSVSIDQDEAGPFELLVDYGDGTYYSTTIEMPEDSRPEIEDAEVNEAGTAFTATFSEDIATIDIDEDSENPFTVLIDGVEADVATVSNAGTANELLFTFEETVDIKADATVTVSYDADANEVDNVNVLEDLNGNEAESFDGYVVDNSSAAPELLTATTGSLNANTIELKYDEAIRVASTMNVDGDDFRVMIGGAPVQVTNFAIVDTTPGGDPILDPDVEDTIQLTLAVDVPNNVSVSVTYNGMAIQDNSGNTIPAITNQTVLNLNQN
ncbi:SwmB domain-containing protein [Jeotgalibacillus sp. JSM ZJ347]|uniref:SwmB domain-containing protein n=1 Tax=Jeotgalibacillus sp. JSM ZJ347 TaxID=3342117 RepID=UPI0035A88043